MTEQSKNDNQQQQLIHAALDSALEELDSDDDDNDDDEDNETFSDCISHEHDILHSEKRNELPPPLPKARVGPPKPPVAEGDMNELFASMMEQLLTSADGTTTTESGSDALADIMSHMTEDEVLGRFMHEMQTRLQSELSTLTAPSSSTNNNNNSTTTATKSTTKHTANTPSHPSSSSSRNIQPPRSPPSSVPPPTPLTPPTTETPNSMNNNNNNSDVESVISNLVNNLSQTMNRHINDDDDDDDVSELDELPDMDDDMIKNITNNGEMAELLQKLMGDLMNADSTDATTSNNDNNNASMNSDAIIDGMMEQLLCKEIMYEPMKQVADQFPRWLQEQQAAQALLPTEYERRCRQNDCFQTIVQTYEMDPVPMSRLIELMQEVQEYGPPPADLIHSLAPGMALDEQGVPVMTTTTHPFPPFGNKNDDECRIM